MVGGIGVTVRVLRAWVVGLCLGGAASVLADEKASVYTVVEVPAPVFAGTELGLLEVEKKQLASQISAYVANELGEKVAKGDRRASEQARRAVALAMNLDPRNRQALVVNFQLGRGLAPRKLDADYSLEVLSQVLVTRGKLLREQEGGANAVLAGYLLQLAVEMYPRNEDAIYEWEMFKLDEATVDWGLLLGGAETGS